VTGRIPVLDESSHVETCVRMTYVTKLRSPSSQVTDTELRESACQLNVQWFAVLTKVDYVGRSSGLR